MDRHFSCGANDTPEPVSRSSEAPSQSNPAALPVIRSEELLRGGREVLIEHEGSVYRLRETRNGKLILHK